MEDLNYTESLTDKAKRKARRAVDIGKDALDDINKKAGARVKEKLNYRKAKKTAYKQAYRNEEIKQTIETARAKARENATKKQTSGSGLAAVGGFKRSGSSGLGKVTGGGFAKIGLKKK